MAKVMKNRKPIKDALDLAGWRPLTTRERRALCRALREVATRNPEEAAVEYVQVVRYLLEKWGDQVNRVAGESWADTIIRLLKDHRALRRRLSYLLAEQSPLGDE